MRMEALPIKFLLILAAFGLAPWGAAQAQDTADDWNRVPLGSDRIYVPSGFDDNDRVRIGLDAWLQNTCQQPSETHVEVDTEQRVISVVPSAIEPNVEGLVCGTLAKRLPLIVDIGYLPHGDYEVVTSNGWLVERLHIAEAESAGPDQYTYAKVDSASMMFNEEAGRWQLFLSGELNSGCESIAAVNIQTDGHMVEVLPVVERNESVICTPKVEKFKMVQDLDQPLQAEERYMLHVRSKGGNDFSKIVQLEQ